jgi:hypothetical protein
MIMETYAAPNTTICDVADSVNGGGLDPLGDFQRRVPRRIQDASRGTTMGVTRGRRPRSSARSRCSVICASCASSHGSSLSVTA